MTRCLVVFVAGLVVITETGAPPAVVDPPKAPPPPAAVAKYRAVPVGAIKIPLRDVQQNDDYSCGAAVMMSVLSYYNVGLDDLPAYRRELRTDPEEGTYYLDMQKLACRFGLRAELKQDMTTEMLSGYIDQGIPVICSIQAWGDDGADYEKKTDNGHYVVAIGYDDAHFYFMDPAANAEEDRANPRYAYLRRTEFLKRWHGDEGFKGKPELRKRGGIVIYPDPDKESPLLRAREIE